MAGICRIPAGPFVANTKNTAILSKIPGLINAHHHLYQVFSRNLPQVQNMELFDWLVTLYEIWKGLNEGLAVMVDLDGGDFTMLGVISGIGFIYSILALFQYDDKKDIDTDAVIIANACRHKDSDERRCAALHRNQRHKAGRAYDNAIPAIVSKKTVWSYGGNWKYKEDIAEKMDDFIAAARENGFDGIYMDTLLYSDTSYRHRAPTILSSEIDGGYNRPTAKPLSAASPQRIVLFFLQNRAVYIRSALVCPVSY